MLPWILENKELLITTALFVCSEWLSLNDKVKSNGIFQLALSWLRSNAPKKEIK